MTRSAKASSRRLLLDRLKRLETKPTGPPAAPLSGYDELQIAVDHGLDHSRVLAHLQPPDPEKGPRTRLTHKADISTWLL